MLSDFYVPSSSSTPIRDRFAHGVPRLMTHVSSSSRRENYVPLRELLAPKTGIADQWNKREDTYWHDSSVTTMAGEFSTLGVHW